MINGSSTPDGEATIDGAATFYSDDDLPPGNYIYSVTGYTDGLASTEAYSPEKAFELIAPSSFSCTTILNDVHLSWDNESTHYTELQILRDDLVIETVDNLGLVMVFTGARHFRH